MRLFKPALALLAALLTLSACDDKKRTDVSTATLVCDNSFENIMKQEIDVF